MNNDDGNDGRESGPILGAGGGCRGRGGEDGGLARLCRGRAERAARYNWDITPCSSAAVSCSSRGWDGEEGGGGVRWGEAARRCLMPVIMLTDTARWNTGCTKGRQLQIVDIYANTNDCMSAAR